MVEQFSTAAKFADTPKRQWLTPLAIWLLVSAVLIGTHFDFYFHQFHYEIGDFAANALQIRKAKSFHELYGNYSRWGFHHPGPAFLYAYAAGEAAFYDACKVVPTAYNAHAITGVLIQGFFFAWAMTIISRRIQRPLLLPLLLVLAALHFGMVNSNIPDSAFQSIWPPYVLLFPFLCFLVAGASVGSGEVGDLIPLVISGCLLVHGHVAQPLFVVPLTFLAYIALCWRDGRSILRQVNSSPYVHASAAGILTIFLLPLVLDAFLGQQSNLHLILGNLFQHSADHKTFFQSLTYFATFLCYIPNPEAICDHLTSSSVLLLLRRWPLLITWSGIGILATVLTRIAIGKQNAAERRFSYWLALWFWLGCGLTIVWGMLQNGEMFLFNSHFTFSLLFIPFALIAIALSSIFDSTHIVYLARLLYATSLPLFILASKNWDVRSDFPNVPPHSEVWFAQVRQAALEDPQESRIKFLKFEHDEWPWAVGVALTLERLGFDYAVSPSWGFMFGYDHAMDIVSATFEKHLPVWTVGARGSNREGFTISSGADLAYGTEVSFGKGGNSEPFRASGWSGTESQMTWTEGTAAVLAMRVAPTNEPVALNMKLAGLTKDPELPYQPVEVYVNNQKVADWQLVADPAEFSAPIPQEMTRRGGPIRITLRIPKATSRKALGMGTDPRILGVACFDLQLALKAD